MLRDLQLVISDWSGVISDDRKPVYEANCRVLERHGLKRLGFDQWLEKTYPSAPAFLAAYGLVESPERLHEEYIAALNEVRAEGICPVLYPDARSFIETVTKTGREFAVISSHPAEHLAREAEEYDIVQFISTITGSVSDKALAIRDLISSRDLDLANVIYLGDMTFDVLAAKRAGVTSVGVATGYQTRELLATAEPDLLVHSLTELMTYITDLRNP